MRHIADREVPRLSQTKLDACGETNVAPETFSLNQNNIVCLPVVSDSQKLIWVHSNQIDLQLDGKAELEKAFDRFPYLTEKETAALAQHSSLHPDQVKVWFMLQRLHYGISWDYEDIHEVWTKVGRSQGMGEMQNRMREEIEEDSRQKKQKWEVNESDANEGKMTGENVKANEQLEGKMTQERPVKKVDKVQEDKRRRKKKWQRIRATNEVGKKRMKQVNKGVVERAGEVKIKGDQEREQQNFIQSETKISTRKKKVKAIKKLMSVQECPAVNSFVVPDEPVDVSPLLFPQPQTQALNVPPLSDSHIDLLKKAEVNLTTTPNIQNMTPLNSNFEMEERLEEEPHVDLNHKPVVSDVGKLKELIEMNNLVADSSPIFTPQQDSQVGDPCTIRTRTRCNMKTQSQLAMMKSAFSHCQYPDSEEYNRLAMVIGISRYVLVQWFSDMRYYIKKGKPRWMTEEQHSQALANIRYRQCLNALQKVQAIEGIGNTTCSMVLESRENFAENKSVNMLPEYK